MKRSACAFVGRRQHLIFGRVRAAVADVVENRVVEQQRFLGDQADLLAQLAELRFADVHAVDLDRALLRIVKPWDQAHQRALAAAVGPTMAIVSPNFTRRSMFSITGCSSS